jgi:hypothetical protein
MAKQLHAEIEIDAHAERVWQVLTDFRAYAEWNPFMTRASGTAAVGERLTIRMEPEAGPAMTFRPTVLEAAPERRLRWLGRLLLPKIFDGEHSFTIEPLDQGRVRLIQQEEFRGILAPLLARSLDSGTRPAFERMNRALKRRAEQGDWAVRCSVDHVVRPTRVATRETMEGRRARRPDEVARFGERRSRPSFPTTSGNAPALAVTRGVAQAIASTAGSENPSYSDRTTATSAQKHRGPTHERTA